MRPGHESSRYTAAAPRQNLEPDAAEVQRAIGGAEIRQRKCSPPSRPRQGSGKTCRVLEHAAQNLQTLGNELRVAVAKWDRSTAGDASGETGVDKVGGMVGAASVLEDRVPVAETKFEVSRAEKAHPLHQLLNVLQ